MQNIEKKLKKKIKKHRKDNTYNRSYAAYEMQLRAGK